MELNDRLLAEVAEIFGKVQYGRITFYPNPEKKTLDYSVETYGKLQTSQKKRLTITANRRKVKA